MTTILSKQSANEQSSPVPGKTRGGGLARALSRTLLVRVAELAGFLVLLVTALFFLVRVQADPAVVLAGPEASPEDVQAVRVLYGFDHSLIVQYWNFLSRFLLFHFGNSVQERSPALSVALHPAATTVLLCTLATALNLLVATPIGAYLGRPARRRAGHKLVSGAVIGAQGLQFYIVALLLVLLLAVRSHVFPATGFTGVQSWVLPSVSLAWLAAPRLARVVASAAGQVWASEIVVGAHAFGLRERTIQYRYVLPNVLVPLISTAGTQFTLMLSGAVVIEGLFGINGLGQLLVLAVQNSDFPVLSASVTLIGIVVFIVTTLSDILYRIVDPRLRRSGS